MDPELSVCHGGNFSLSGIENGFEMGVIIGDPVEKNRDWQHIFCHWFFKRAITHVLAVLAKIDLEELGKRREGPKVEQICIEYREK